MLKETNYITAALMNNLVKDIIIVDQRPKKAFYSSCDEKSTCISAAVGSI